MASSMKIDLSFTQNALSATATIALCNYDQKVFNFLLNNELNIEEIWCNHQKADWHKTEELTPLYRPQAQKIAISSAENIDTIIIKYSGSITGWHNTLSDELVALSFYSVWYPQELPIEIDKDEVIIHDATDYFVVKGTFDEDQKIWLYGNQGYDPFNILAYKKSALSKVASPQINIYFIDEKISEMAEKAKFYYSDVVTFYNGQLFNAKSISTLDIACLSPIFTEGGAYKRKDLIVSVNLGDNDLETARLYAHEMAHLWCAGADINTWEDWLNETTAEWSALLYALDRKNMDLFDFIINRHLERFDSLPPIKTSDNTRPEGIHSKGTVLFYQIYKKYRAEVIRDIVRIFVNLDTKNTDSFVKEIRTSISSEVAAFIENGIRS